MLTIQYISDLHIEFLGIERVRHLFKITNADVLVLAGDICSIADREFDNLKFLDFLKYVCPKYKYVLHVAGNHEYYTNTIRGITQQATMQTVNKKLKDLEKIHNNYFYLNHDKKILEINGKPYYFMGCTLWTHVDEENKKRIQSGMNDYVYINVNKNDEVKRYTVDDMQTLHTKGVNFIKRCIKDKPEVTHILITHHRPFLSDEESARRDDLIQAYQSDLSKVIKSPVKIAIFGHCHERCDKIINGVRYLSNCLGYKYQRTNFNPMATIDID